MQLFQSFVQFENVNVVQVFHCWNEDGNFFQTQHFLILLFSIQILLQILLDVFLNNFLI